MTATDVDTWDVSGMQCSGLMSWTTGLSRQSFRSQGLPGFRG